MRETEGRASIRHYIDQPAQLDRFAPFEFRNDASNRWSARRNGSPGLGPFTIEARQQISKKIDALEDQVNDAIVDNEERSAIASLRKLDHLPRLNFKNARTAIGISSRKGLRLPPLFDFLET
jgi:hypothetical protein